MEFPHNHPKKGHSCTTNLCGAQPSNPSRSGHCSPWQLGVKPARSCFSPSSLTAPQKGAQSPSQTIPISQHCQGFPLAQHSQVPPEQLLSLLWAGESLHSGQRAASAIQGQDALRCLLCREAASPATGQHNQCHCPGHWGRGNHQEHEGHQPTLYKEPREQLSASSGEAEGLHCLHCGHCSRCQPCQEQAISSDLSLPALSSIRGLQETR